MLFKVLLAGMCSLCLVGTATLASAHEFIVKPDKTQAAKGESVGVQAQAAHVFMISEEAEPVETVVVELIQGNVINGMKSSGKKRDNLGSIGKDFRWECNSIAESATKKEGNQPSFFVV